MKIAINNVNNINNIRMDYSYQCTLVVMFVCVYIMYICEMFEYKILVCNYYMYMYVNIVVIQVVNRCCDA